MRRIVLLAVCFATAAWGGETLLGKLVVSDGGTTSNRTTGWTAYAGAGSFVVTPLTKISIQCDTASYVLTDVSGCDAGNCIAVAAGQFFTTSVNTSKTLTGKAYNSDGGTAGTVVTYTGGWVSQAPQSTAASTCYVFGRNGGE